MLAHILVHQSQLSEKSVDMEGEEKSSGEKTATMDADVQHLALTLGSSSDYANVVMAILEHVKASLVSKENKERHQTLQGLRLLMLVFGQARAPLLGILLKAVSEPLEALVAEGHSQLHLLLLDVLLAAYRCVHMFKWLWFSCHSVHFFITKDTLLSVFCFGCFQLPLPRQPNHRPT